MTKKKIPIVAIIGSPNVGKSALFNRLIKKRVAIVEDTPGVTRDRNYGQSDWNGRYFTVIDTGGFIPGSLDEIEVAVRKQAEYSINEADIILFIVDGKTGLMDQDIEVANLLRKHNKPVFLAVNKIDNNLDYSSWTEFYTLGLGNPYPISALHGNGVADLFDDIVKKMPDSSLDPEEEDVAKIAIVGRPNVGKSSLVNVLLGENRVIVSAKAGTTRDAIDSRVTYKDKTYILIDTAGIRRKTKVSVDLEYYSVNRAMQSIRRADIAVLVVDAEEGVTAQDARLAGYIEKEGTCCILVINKWDLVEKQVDKFLAKFADREQSEEYIAPTKEKKTQLKHDPRQELTESMLPKDRGANIETAMREYMKHIEKNLYFMTWAPVIFTSALDHKRVQQIFDMAGVVIQERSKRISTAELNRFLEKVVDHWQPPEKQAKEVKLYYITQTDTTPPHFTLFVNLRKSIPDEYMRYLLNCIRDEFGFIGTPITLNIRAKQKTKQ